MGRVIKVVQGQGAKEKEKIEAEAKKEAEAVVDKGEELVDKVKAEFGESRAKGWLKSWFTGNGGSTSSPTTTKVEPVIAA